MNELYKLTALAKDLYQEGYQCGVSGDDSERWFRAWAIAMKSVADGEDYHDDLVISCFMMPNSQANQPQSGLR